MAHCPNCGRETLRTKDWACQWCGYQLLTGFYRRIDKTYKELQMERQQAAGVEQAAGADIEEEKDLSREPESASEYRPEPVRESRPEPGPPTRVVPPPRIEAKPPVQPKSEPVSVPAPEPVRPQTEIKPEPEFVSRMEASPPPISVSPKAEAIQPAAPEPAAVVRPEPELRPEPVPVAQPEPAPAPASTPVPIEVPPPPSLESIVEGTLLYVDQLDALYRTDRGGIHTRLTGKMISVKGIVEKVVIRDHLDVRYLLLKGAGKTNTWNVRCSFEREHNSEMGRLSEGQSVTVKGFYDGASKNILFKNCALLG
jgi:hypothetical protein